MKFIKENRLVIVMMVVSIIITMLCQNYLVKDYSRVNNESTDFISAKVKDIQNSQINYDESLKIYLGKQEVTLELLQGDSQGKTIVVTNHLTATHQVEAKVGQRVIVSEDHPKNIEAYYTIYNYDHHNALLVSLMFLCVVVIAIGKGKGIKAIIGLVYTLFIIVGFVLPMIFSGYSPIIMSIVAVSLSSIVTLLLLNGHHQKTYCAIIATVIGVGIAGCCFFVMSKLFFLNGFSVDEVESLVFIQQSTGLQIKDILFAGVLISCLGAVMDVAMSIVSSLHELKIHHPDITQKEIFISGMEIGKDMIGTMMNTLILAFTGSAFVVLLILFSYQVDAMQLINSNYLVLEIVQGLTGTLGVVLTVPVASLITSSYICQKNI